MNDAEKFLKELSKSIREQAKQFNNCKLQLEGTSFEIYHMLQMEEFMRREAMERDCYIAVSKIMSDYGIVVEPDELRELLRCIVLLKDKGIDTSEKLHELLHRCEKEGIL